MTQWWNKACVAAGLTSYRYNNGRWGYITIGAIDVADALVHARRSMTEGVPTAAGLEVWNGYEYVQAVDPQPGVYYVDAMNELGDKWWPLVGPLPDHATALALVDQVRAMACELSHNGIWMKYGTCRYKEPGDLPVGKLNGYFGL